MYERLSVITRSQERLEDITGRVNEIIRRNGIDEGVCYLFLPHTTAGLMVNENADPNLAADFLAHLRKLAPASTDFRHADGNAHAHIKASLVGHSLTIPVEDGRLALGHWQGVFLAEFDGPRDRTVAITLISRGQVPRAEQIPGEFRRRP